MTIRRFFALCVSVGTIGGAFWCWNSPALAQTEAAPGQGCCRRIRAGLRRPGGLSLDAVPRDAPAGALNGSLPGLSIASPPTSPSGFSESQAPTNQPRRIPTCFTHPTATRTP